MITGKTLIDLGYKPAKWFGKAIEEANKRNLEGDNLISFIRDWRMSRASSELSI